MIVQATVEISVTLDLDSTETREFAREAVFEVAMSDLVHTNVAKIVKCTELPFIVDSK